MNPTLKGQCVRVIEDILVFSDFNLLEFLLQIIPQNIILKRKAATPKISSLMEKHKLYKASLTLLN